MLLTMLYKFLAAAADLSSLVCYLLWSEFSSVKKQHNYTYVKTITKTIMHDADALSRKQPKNLKHVFTRDIIIKAWQ